MEHKSNLSLEDVKQMIIPTLKQNDVVHAAIFGSFVHGEQKEDSDIDILLVRLQFKLEDILGVPADVLTYDCLHPQTREYVLKEQVVIF
jgi:uncharacterized protein